MEYKSNEVKAGALVFLALVIFFGFVFAITKSTFKTAVKTYKCRFQYTNGIQSGSLVRIGGMLIGQVKQLEFPADDNTRVEVTLEVAANAPVKESSEAFITSIGIMGEYYVEITTGSLDSPLLPGDSFLRSKDLAPLAQMGEPLEKVSAQLEELLSHFNELMNEKNRGHITNMIASIDTILQNSQDSSVKLVGNLASLSQKLEKLSDRLDTVMAQNSSTVSEALLQMNSSLAQAESLMVDLSESVTHVNSVISVNEASLYEVLQNLQDASKNFDAFSRRIKEQPWSLVRKSAVPERKLPK